MTAATRKLTAILAADVAGYSRLMGADEEGTLNRLKEHRRELIDPKIAEHRGRIVKTTGDGLLVEFSSVVDAVKCAVEIQKAMREREADLAADQLIQFRIGVNTGDVIIDGDDIHGDGVNVAARLEALAEPGAICVSGGAWDQVRGKVAVTADDLGEKKLKNIERSVRVYRITTEASLNERLALALPDKPSIAVLPFQNMSGDPEQEYFADGMVEEITTGLSRVHSLFVIARNSSFTYKGKAVDVKQIGRELGVRYLVEGSVRKSANRARVTAQLIDTMTSAHLWADRYDRGLDDIFAIQDEITENVVASVEAQLYVAESRRARNKPPANLDAWDYAMRALAHINMMTASEVRRALDFAEKAMERDPTYARPYALWAWANARLAVYGWGGNLEGVAEAAEKAVALDGSDPWGQAILGLVYYIQNRNSQAIDALGRAIDLNPNFAYAHSLLGMALAGDGRPEEAIEQVDRAVRMSPRDPQKHSFFQYYAIAHSVARRYEEAIRWGLKAIGERPEYILAHRFLVSNYALSGDIERARAALVVLKRLQPSISLAWIRENFAQGAPRHASVVEGLRLAGLT